MEKVDVYVGTYQGAPQKGDVNATINQIGLALAKAAADNLELLLFPELFLCGYDIGKDSIFKCAIAQSGNEISRLCDLAREHNIAFAIGYAELVDEARTPVIYNSCCLIDCTGKLVLNYRKTHLWDPKVEYEKVIFRTGTDLPVAQIHFSRKGIDITVGILICFDSEFPEPARVLALKGANLLLICTALAEGLIDDVTPKITIPCRAADNHVFVVYSNHVGPFQPPVATCETSKTASECAEHAKCNFCGQSGIFDPSGATLVQANKTESGIFSAHLVGRYYEEHVNRNNYLHERRAELYGALST